MLDPGAGLTERIVTLPDGRRLRAITAGEGDGPLVVFEAGMSSPAAPWNHTQRAVSTSARTLSYDRAGYAGSDVDRQPRTLERIVHDLTALLDALGESEPVVLVGHSWGGPIIRLFASEHPDRVAGMVFVDASLAETMPGYGRALASVSFGVMSLIARLGGKGLIMKAAGSFSPEYSDEDKAIVARDYASSRAMAAGRREAVQIRAALPVMRRLQEAGTPAVPTICVVAGRVDRGMATLRPILIQTSTDLMNACADGRVVMVEDAGHLIPQEKPQPVIDAILDVTSRAKAVRS